MKRLEFTSNPEDKFLKEELYFGTELKTTQEREIPDELTSMEAVGNYLRSLADNDIEVYLNGKSQGMGLVEASAEAAAQTEDLLQEAVVAVEDKSNEPSNSK